jgi:HSP20 family molecular chaperone IbpA
MNISLYQKIAGIKEMDKMELHARNPFETDTWASVDISEENDKCIIRYVCRDMEATDFDVSVFLDMLTIKGNKKNEHCASFDHEFQLPAYLNADKARATFGHDTLKIIVPKIED